MRKKLTTRQKLEKAKNRLNKLTEKRSKLIVEKKNTLIRARIKARQQFKVIGKNEKGIWYKTHQGETVQTDRKQITLSDAEEWQKYQELEGKIKDTNEKLWNASKSIRKYEEREKKEQQKDNQEWETNYWTKAISYIKDNGVDSNLLGRSVNTYLRTANNWLSMKQNRKDIVKGPRQWLKYNRGRVK